VRTTLLTVVTLLAFAGNSLLCRAALRDGAMDPLSFTALRLVSGALVLLPLLRRPGAPWNPRAGLALGGYAVAFSLAYISLDAGVGALLLFGSVQVTMFLAAWRRGERMTRLQTCGLAAAVGGLLFLLLPGASAPDPAGSALMVLAGVGWGTYSLFGRRVAVPAVATARNFALAAPLALLTLPFASLEVSSTGVWLAVASGAGTSGLGYVVWYAALRGLDTTRAAVVQLAVPVIAALGGALLLGEVLGARLVVAGSVTLAGVAVAVLAKR
jgi:drug/metabolite transporter (DMT)-like permease